MVTLGSVIIANAALPTATFAAATPTTPAIITTAAVQAAQMATYVGGTQLSLAAEPIAVGMPVCVSRTPSAPYRVARADTYVLGYAIGLALATAAAGYALTIGLGSVTLADWTVVAGTRSLVPGVPYFLAPAGGLTTTVPSKSTSVVSLLMCVATSSNTVLIQRAPPLIL